MSVLAGGGLRYWLSHHISDVITANAPHKKMLLTSKDTTHLANVISMAPSPFLTTMTLTPDSRLTRVVCPCEEWE